MRHLILTLSLAVFVLCGLTNPLIAHAEEDENWVKYCSWKGQVDELLVLRIENETIKAVFPVSSGYKDAKIDFFAGDPKTECAAKIEVTNGRGHVAIRKQYWQKPDSSITVQILDEEPGFGQYEFTVFYCEKELSPYDKAKYEDSIDKALYIYDVYHMNMARAKGNLVDAKRWARSAYEIDRLNWDILNIIGELHYLLNEMEKAEDVFIILRDYGYLTEENMERFKELNAYEASKKPGEDEETEEEK